jgi:hypothetical protein
VIDDRTLAADAEHGIAPRAERATLKPCGMLLGLAALDMDNPHLAHLELLAEVDALVAELDDWSGHAPHWPPARSCQALVKRLTERTEALRVRLDAPLVVATLGGTGTGKSSLVNALVGSEVSQAGRERPTTRQPTLICRSDITPALLGIDPNSVRLVQCDAPLLRNLVLLDCPDPDTAESDQTGTNLDRLRHLLPHCDVLLVTSTQQKYRSQRVTEELAAAAHGARLVFVQTHADSDSDIRADWRKQLSAEYAVGEMFFVDSLQALADAQSGLAPRGEFGRLVDFLSRELIGAAQTRIRRANFLDLVEQTLGLCGQRIDAALPAVEQVQEAIAAERARLSQKLALAMRDELLASRRQWEGRLLGEVVSRWGLSPFSLVLRAYHGLGGLLSGAALWRVRTPVQMALWGTVEGTRAIARKQQERKANDATSRAVAFTWDEGELRIAATTIDGYAAEAGLRREPLKSAALAREAAAAGTAFVAGTAGQLQTLIRRQAARHVGWFTRLRYELALLVVLGLLLYRLGRNFFWDSWLAYDLGYRQAPAEVLGADFFVPALFWLLVWCGVLVWAFTSRLRRGLKGEINLLAEQWANSSPVRLFAPLEEECGSIHDFRDRWQRLMYRVAAVRTRLSQPSPALGQRIA